MVVIIGVRVVLRSIPINQLNEAERLNKFPDNYAKKEMTRTKTMAKIWPYFFFFTVGTGLLAGLFLLWAFVCKLIG